MNEMVKNLLLWVVIAVILVIVVQSFKVGGGDPGTVAYSEFMAQVNNGNVSEVLIHNDMK
ncbi:MAG: ATP-dependent metallopeptidase FtsH/Yme1/Tma family protein, partial [Rudaea sp.]